MGFEGEEGNEVEDKQKKENEGFAYFSRFRRLNLDSPMPHIPKKEIHMGVIGKGLGVSEESKSVVQPMVLVFYSQPTTASPACPGSSVFHTDSYEPCSGGS